MSCEMITTETNETISTMTSLDLTFFYYYFLNRLQIKIISTSCFLNKFHVNHWLTKTKKNTEEELQQL